MSIQGATAVETAVAEAIYEHIHAGHKSKPLHEVAGVWQRHYLAEARVAIAAYQQAVRPGPSVVENLEHIWAFLVI